MSGNLMDAVLQMVSTGAEPEDYTGEDGLLYCGKCHKPKEAYFPQGKVLFGRDRHPSECDCRRAERERQEKRESDEKHNAEVERLKREGFSNPAMRHWTFENDNGKFPQIGKAYSYVEKWETVRSENLGYLLWGNVGSGKSYFAGCIANALMERGTEYGLEQVYNVIDSRYVSKKPLIATTNLTPEQLKNPEDVPHARIYGRLLEMCVPVRFTGGDFRRIAAQQKKERLKELMMENKTVQAEGADL